MNAFDIVDVLSAAGFVVTIEDTGGDILTLCAGSDTCQDVVSVGPFDADGSGCVGEVTMLTQEEADSAEDPVFRFPKTAADVLDFVRVTVKP